MTQVFDQKTGAYAGHRAPGRALPRRAVRTQDDDGYAAVQIACEEVAERKLSQGRARSPEEGRRRGGTATSSSSATSTSSAAGDTVTVGRFEPGQAVKVSGISQGKGFAGTIKRHNFHRGPLSHGSHNKRAPGSIGASAWPARVSRACDAGPHG